MKYSLLALLIVTLPVFADPVDAQKIDSIPSQKIGAPELVENNVNLEDQLNNEIDKSNEQMLLKIKSDIEKNAEALLLTLPSISE